MPYVPFLSIIVNNSYSASALRDGSFSKVQSAPARAAARNSSPVSLDPDIIALSARVSPEPGRRHAMITAIAVSSGLDPGLDTTVAACAM